MKKKLLYEYSEDLEFRRILDESKKASDEFKEMIRKQEEDNHTAQVKLGTDHWTKVYHFLNDKGLIPQFKNVEEFLSEDSRKNDIHIDRESKCIFSRELTDDEIDDHTREIAAALGKSGRAFKLGKGDLKKLLETLGLT